jgi:LysM repeat protein
MFRSKPPVEKSAMAAPAPKQDRARAPQQPPVKTCEPRPAASQSEAQPAGAEPGGNPPDLTRWIAFAGAAVFAVLIGLAVLFFAMGQFRDLPAMPTSVITDATALASTAEAQPSATAAAVAGDGNQATPQATATIAPTPEPLTYTIAEGDTLVTVAEAYGVSLAEILALNPSIVDPNQVGIGQQILIPAPVPTPLPLLVAGATVGAFAPGPDAGSTPTGAIFEGDLAGAYPLTRVGRRLAIHYQPGSFTEQSGADAVLAETEEILSFVEQKLDVSYRGALDVYLAGELFAEPQQALRGRAYPTQRRLFVLFDGTGTPAERRYLVAHEMTHVVAWHTYGIPDTVLLSEGLASYAGQDYLAEGGFISYQSFCRALASANRLPSIASIQNSLGGFQGHIQNLYYYSAAACFVGHLFEDKGPPAFAELYPTSNYSGHYGMTLGELDVDFQQSLAAEDGPALDFDAGTLVAYYDEVRADYDRLLADPRPDEQAYQVLDRARIAVVTGDFTAARSMLDEFNSIAP